MTTKLIIQCHISSDTELEVDNKKNKSYWISQKAEHPYSLFNGHIDWSLNNLFEFNRKPRDSFEEFLALAKHCCLVLDKKTRKEIKEKLAKHPGTPDKRRGMALQPASGARYKATKSPHTVTDRER